MFININVLDKKQGEVYFAKINVCMNKSFGIDTRGRVWGWGQGSMGFINQNLVKKPQIIQFQAKDQKITKIYSNMVSTVFFSPLRVQSI